MSRNLLNKYIWLLETIERHGRLSRAELNDLWYDEDKTWKGVHGQGGSRWRGAHSTTTATA